MALPTINNISFCTGTGMLEEGFALGCEYLRLGQVRTVCNVERQAYAAALLVARMEAKAVAEIAASGERV